MKKIPAAAMLSVSALLLLSDCGGGDSPLTVGIEGSGAPPPVPAGASGIVSNGVISGLGSIFVEALNMHSTSQRSRSMANPELPPTSGLDRLSP